MEGPLCVSSLIVTSAFIKKKNSKMRYLKKIVKPMEVNRTCIDFTNFFLDVSSLIYTTSAFVKKERSKMTHLKKFVKPMGVKLRSKMSH